MQSQNRVAPSEDADSHVDQHRADDEPPPPLDGEDDQGIAEPDSTGVEESEVKQVRVNKRTTTAGVLSAHGRYPTD